ncbi:unnamed protein product [Caenorhabditis auriculariae]|uniref:Uncharacterized protein n=1 Tax=Caenorhabditis auriculariae TaxID=2777116 RepID=A0A8S1HL71_9PELO|nr:unnamed protein product [Caenorhabditis auriculariae]
MYHRDRLTTDTLLVERFEPKQCSGSRMTQNACAVGGRHLQNVETSSSECEEPSPIPTQVSLVSPSANNSSEGADPITSDAYGTQTLDVQTSRFLKEILCQTMTQRPLLDDVPPLKAAADTVCLRNTFLPSVLVSAELRKSGEFFLKTWSVIDCDQEKSELGKPDEPVAQRRDAFSFRIEQHLINPIRPYEQDENNGGG